MTNCQKILGPIFGLATWFVDAIDDIPSVVLPVAVWFDSVDDLSTGIGHMSEDACASPLSN
jgi:hypothetical protein